MIEDVGSWHEPYEVRFLLQKYMSGSAPFHFHVR